MDTAIVGLILVIVTAITSYKGINDRTFLQAYAFNVGSILDLKDYKRIITSGFLHVGWVHLGFNMVSLYSFASSLGHYINGIQLLLIYFASLIGGSLLSLFMHRYNRSYTAMGASGAVSGIVFASIAVSPENIGLMFLPRAGIPPWAFGLFFIVFTIFGIRSRFGNIGHEAHLGGAIIGQLIMIAFRPEALIYNPLPIVLTMVPAGLFLYLVIQRPAFLVTGSFTTTRHGETSDDRYNADKKKRQAEVDRILDKINVSGFDSLTTQERDRLDKLTR